MRIKLMSFVLLLGSCLFLACKSTPKGPGSDSLAAVTVKGRSMLEVAKAASAVFQEEGFMPVPQVEGKETTLVFERKGTTGDKILYGDWDTKPIWYRARVRLTPLDSTTQLVRCDAFRVKYRGETHFEEEHALSSTKAGYYRELLEKTKTRAESGS
jgi:hypothetical protein